MKRKNKWKSLREHRRTKYEDGPGEREVEESPPRGLVNVCSIDLATRALHSEFTCHTSGTIHLPLQRHTLDYLRMTARIFRKKTIASSWNSQFRSAFQWRTFFLFFKQSSENLSFYDKFCLLRRTLGFHKYETWCIVFCPRLRRWKFARSFSYEGAEIRSTKIHMFKFSEKKLCADYGRIFHNF